MFGAKRERNRILHEAERLFFVASIHGQVCDKILFDIAQLRGIPYTFFDPWRVFVYTLAGASVAAMTASLGPMNLVGLGPFSAAIDRGRQRQLDEAGRHPFPGLNQFAALFDRPRVEAMMMDYLRFRHAPENATHDAQENVGQWVWLQIRQAPPGVDESLAEVVRQTLGLSIIREFGPYWLTEHQRKSG